MKDVRRIAQEQQARAWEVIREARVMEAWQSTGAQINLVGSLRTGLLIRHLDIDFHIYLDPVDPAISFQAVAALARNPRVRRVAYSNLLDAEDMCLEWHAWYEDPQGDTWQIDMIHIAQASRYAGYFEQVADRINAVIDEGQRDAILSIKYAIPEDRKVMGVKIYMAVIRDGVRDYEQFVEWEKLHPEEGIITWMP
ncbi:MAG: nucleotidyltransferase domain-containing protein [Phycisphaerae bacterium]|nr:nucleotidyltransferase domain-containing protein [Phycisphaerae bacterium]